jgi:hypothetical protein
VKQHAFAIFGGSHETFELGLFADAGLGKRFRFGAKGKGSQIQLHFPALTCFDLI